MRLRSREWVPEKLKVQKPFKPPQNPIHFYFSISEFDRLSPFFTGSLIIWLLVLLPC